MCDQYRLHDAVNKSRVEPFHWYLGLYLEGNNGAFRHSEDAVCDKSTMEVEGGADVALVTVEESGKKGGEWRENTLRQLVF